MASVYANHVSRTLIREKGTGDKAFASISVETDKSASGWATYAVSMKQVLPSKDFKGNDALDFANIALGSAESTRKLSIMVSEGNYDEIEVTNQEIVDMHKAALDKFRSQKKTKDGVFANNISEKLIHVVELDNGDTFVNVSIPMEQSTSGFGRITVATAQVYDAIDYNTKQPRDGFKNVLLGKAERIHKVQIDKGDKDYDVIEMTSAAISDAFKKNKEAFKAKMSEQRKEAGKSVDGTAVETEESKTMEAESPSVE